MNTCKVDNKKRVVIPAATPGQVFALVSHADGTFTLSPVTAAEHKPGILDGIKPLTKAAAKRAYGPSVFDSLHHAHATSRTRVRRPMDFE